MTSAELIINGLTVAAGGALVIERVTEYLKHVQKRLQQQQAEEQLFVDEQQAIEQALQQARQWPESELSVEAGDDEFEQYTAVPVLERPRPSINQARIRLFVRLTPLALGLIIAAIMDLQLLALMRGAEVIPLAELWQQGRYGQAWLQWLDTLLSGVFIAGGSQPLHVLIRFLQVRSPLQGIKPLAKSEPIIAADPATSPALPLAYQGGIKPLTLEHVHKRSGDPQQIVVHHSAMHSATSFDTLVNEFLLNKGWLTGYHAVAMPDGEVRSFCRWDRRGNHAKGHNDRTLGIAFHGNFHSDRGDPWANHDGRYGQARPSDVQLDAGARLIAAWIMLYPGIAGVDAVVPHRALSTASTVCPGDRFPWQALIQRIEHWLQYWQQPEQQPQLRRLAQQPMVYVAQVPPRWASNAQEEFQHG